MTRISDTMRSILPLSWRKRIGPFLGYVVYFWRTRIRGKSWEPTVLSSPDTLNAIKDGGLSIIRFGDGELSLISGIDLGFQKYDAELAEKMRQVIKSQHPKLIIGIPGIFGRLEHFAPISFWFEIHHLFRYGHLWRELTEKGRSYGDAFITRPYLSYQRKDSAPYIYQQLKSLWADRDVLLIEGAQSRLGVGNDLFKGVKSIQRILGPAENAFRMAGAIIAKASESPKETLILLSLGPAAKVIGYELFLRGFQVLDIGHVDMEYEMFLRGEDKLVPVKYKYFNEIGARDPEDCPDQTYRSEITASFL